MPPAWPHRGLRPRCAAGCGRVWPFWHLRKVGPSFPRAGLRIVDRRSGPDNVRPLQPQAVKAAPMSHADLAQTIDAAWEARADINAATTGAVREAVETALELLDS